ncbi:MAG TPA: T9SS type A sorting domain-containing protein [Bacteroidia bacterium]|nr:T9SS type A sorting domain-containing protein [Bacteroidia bacterium]
MSIRVPLLSNVVLMLVIFSFSSNTFSQVPQLWGMTRGGGAYNGGTIFKVNGDGSGLQIIYSFDSLTGAWPTGNMVFQDGKLYGVTTGGGMWNRGGLFSFDPANLHYSALYDFDLNSGYQNLGSLCAASNNVIYGMNSFGGIDLKGTVFRYDINNSYFSLVHEFISSDGYWVTDNLLEASNHFLYGLTAFGGNFGVGVLFSIDISNNNLVNHYNFEQSTGADPQGDLIQASNGKLYGMACAGGLKNYGVIYCYDPSLNHYQKVHDFDSIDGRLPVGGLLEADNGILYGLAYHGGTNDKGTLFSFDPVNGSFNKLIDFYDFIGRFPLWNLIQASDRKLYGITIQGGSFRNGTIFSYDINTGVYVKVIDQANFGGAIGKLVEIDSTLFTKTTSVDLKTYFSISPNPTGSTFLIQVNGEIENAELDIFTIHGKQVYSSSLRSKREIIHSELTAGIYFVRVSNGMKNLSRKLIIENK